MSDRPEKAPDAQVDSEQEAGGSGRSLARSEPAEAIAQGMLRRGVGDAVAYGALLQAHPQLRERLLALLHRQFGNAFVAHVLAAADHGAVSGAAQGAVSAGSSETVGVTPQQTVPTTAADAQGGATDEASAGEGALGAEPLLGVSPDRAAPASSSPATERELALTTLDHAIQVAEGEVAKLQANIATIDRSLAPDAVIGQAAAKIASALSSVPFLVHLANADGTLTPALVPFLTKLDNAVSALQILGKRYKVRMRESHLERIFDLEDGILESAGKPALKRAVAYYADSALAVNMYGPTPDADTITKQLTDDNGARPTHRDALLRDVQSLATRLSTALRGGLAEAEGILIEPTKVKATMLESLAAFAADMLLGNVKGIIGKLSKVGLNTVPLPDDVVDMLSEGFKEAGKNAAKGSVSATNRPPKGSHGSDDAQATKLETEMKESALSPRRIYLNAAGRKTDEAMARTTSRFNQKASMFERLPNETLLAILDGVDISGFTDAYRHLVVQEWVNFGKLASDHGVDMRDPVLKDGNPSRLDPAIRPYGVLQIDVRLDEDGKPGFSHAVLPGVGTPVVRDLKMSGKSLGDIAVHRRIQVVGATSIDVGAGSFDVSPAGEITATTALSQRSRRAFARVLGLDRLPSDGEVRASMHKLLTWLHGVGCDGISDNG